MIKFTDDTDKVMKVLLNKAKTGTFKAGEHVKRQSQQIVPHDTGALEQSAEVSTEENNDSITAAVSFNTSYAVEVHENPQRNFQGGRQGKFLESVINNGSTQQECLNIIAGELGGGL
jgi:hypothetical protein